MIAQTAKINSFYKEHAMTYAEISDDWMTITLPSEEKADVSYEVQCARIANGVDVVSCECRGFEYRGHCKHLTVVQEWLEKVIMSDTSEVTCEVEVGKFYIVDHAHQTWLHDGKWFCSCGNAETCKHREAVEQRIAGEEPVIETPAQPVVETAEEYRMSDAVYAKLKATAPVEPKQTYRIISTGAKRERRDLVSEITEKREHKAALLGEISEIKDRKRSEDRMMKAPLTQNRAFSILK